MERAQGWKLPDFENLLVHAYVPDHSANEIATFRRFVFNALPRTHKQVILSGDLYRSIDGLLDADIVRQLSPPSSQLFIFHSLIREEELKNLLESCSQNEFLCVV